MKTKKFNVNWQSVLLGMVLCMVLVAFVGSKAASAQAGTAQGTMQRSIQKVVTMNELMDKCELIDQRILILEEKINRLQDGMDSVLKTLDKMWNREYKK